MRKRGESVFEKRLVEFGIRQVLEAINNCQMFILNTTKYNMCIDTGVVYTYTIIYSC